MSQRQVVLVSLLTVGLCSWLVSERRILAAQEKAIRIQVVDYPRPVAAAVRQIEKQFGRVVTYEDTSYVYADDIVDITEQVRRDGNMAKRVFGRKTGSVDVTYTPRLSLIESQVEDLLHEVIAQSSAAGNAGEFRVVAVSGGYHVIPVAFRGKSGVTEPYSSPLDTRITIQQREGTGFEAVLLLAGAITDRAGRKITPGTMPLTRMDRARVTVDAQNETARNVLWRVLQSIGTDLSWQFLCDVGEKGECAINIHPVRRK